MPSYELILILKKMAKPELAKVLKRTAMNIYNTDGILFGIENLGARSLPFAVRAHGKKHREGSYFIMKFDGPIKSLDVLKDEYRRDVDVLKAAFTRTPEPEQYECALEDELKPPPYREDVQKMIEEGRKSNIYQFQPRTGLDYNPFRT